MQSIVVLSCWVLGALQGAILILVPEMMQQGQLSALQLALPLSLGTLIFMCCSGYWGKLLDARVAQNRGLLSILRWLLSGFLLSQLSFILLLQFSALTGVSLVIALCLSRIMHGIFCSAIIPNAQLVLSRNDKKGEKLVWSSIATNIGRLTAPLLTFVPIAVPYFSLWFIATLLLIAVILACLKSENIKARGELSPANNSLNSTEKVQLFTFLSNPLLLSVCISALLLSLFSSQLQFSLGPLLLVQLSDATLASDRTAGLLFAASASALISLSVLYRPLIRYPKLFLLFIACCFLLGSCLFALQQQLLVAVILISSALSMAPTWYSALAIHASEQHKARTSAAVSQGHTLGNALGALLAGALLMLGQQLLLLSFILLMASILLAWLAVYRQAEKLNERQHPTNTASLL